MWARCLIVAAFSFAAAGFPPAGSPAPLALVPRIPATSTLGVRGAILCRVPAGGPYGLLLDQREHDFSIDILDRNGRAARSVDAFDYGVEQATFPGNSARVIRIRRSDESGINASFELTLVEIQEDRLAETVDAEDTSTAARRLRSRGDGQSLRQAVETWRRAVNAWRVLGRDSNALRSEIALANTLHSLNEYGQARDLYDGAIALSRQLGDQRSLVECLNNRGLGFWQQGDFTQATADWNAALDIWGGLPAQAGRAGTLINLGLLSWQVGEYQSALDHFLEAEKVSDALGDRRSQPYVINNLGLTYGALGDNQKSAALFERAAALFDQAGDHLAAGRALAYSARVCLRMGAAPRAAANLARGLPLIERAGDRRGLAEAWDLLGEVDAQAGRFETALRRQRNALNMFRIVGDRRGEANAIANLGLTSLAGGDATSAVQWLEQSLVIHHTLGTPFSEASVMYQLAIAKSKSGDLDEALRLSQAAVDRAELLRGSVAAEKLRISFLASTHDYYWENLDLLMRCAERRNQPLLQQTAWLVAERCRARSLLEALGASHTPAAGASIDPWERDLTGHINAQIVQLSRAQEANAELRQRLDRSIDELLETQKRARLYGSRLVDSGLPGGLDLAAVQSEALEPGDALIEYALGKDASYAWLIQSDGITAYRLAPREILERPARRMTLLMNSRRPDHAAETDASFRAAAGALSAALITPLLPRLQAKRLLIVPDGALLATPFGALPLPGGKPLLEKFEVVTIPSAAAFLALRRSRNRLPARPLRVAVIADPVFDARDPRVHFAAPPPSPDAGLSRLPFSRREAVSIAALLPAGAVKVLIGFEALKSSFTDGALADYGILHISTHGILDFDRPERSALLFSQVRPDGSSQDGRLSLAEVYGLRLDADLVVLSACQTAFGKEVIGEGAISLSYGFLYAGAHRVVASLWQVDDEATAELLTRFYGEWLRSPQEPPSTVLRRAQLALRSSGRWRSPYYWASLVLQGEP